MIYIVVIQRIYIHLYILMCVRACVRARARARACVCVIYALDSSD